VINKQKTKDKELRAKKISSDISSTSKSSSVTAKSKRALFETKSEPQTMDELLTMVGTIPLGLKRGDTVEGKVIFVSSKEILIDIGKKSFGIVAEWELEQVAEYAKQLKIGDKVIAQVANPENDIGYVILSLRRASSERRWGLLSQLKETGEDLDVVGLEVTKGGVLVDWQGLRGFIPSTQLEGSLAIQPMALINKRMKVKVLEVDRAMNRLVLSQKASALGVTPTFQKEKLDKIKTGDTLQGVVSGIAPFGIFVDIEGLEGLVHISEIAWEKVENPANLFKVGNKLDVVVLDVNQEEGKLNLSIKRLTPDPWKNILDRYPLESTIKGKVVRNAPYGSFISLEPGVEGLLHISKIISGEEPKIGENIECLIEHIDPVRRKISLTLVPKEKPVGYR